MNNLCYVICPTVIITSIFIELMTCCYMDPLQVIHIIHARFNLLFYREKKKEKKNYMTSCIGCVIICDVEIVACRHNLSHSLVCNDNTFKRLMFFIYQIFSLVKVMKTSFGILLYKSQKYFIMILFLLYFEGHVSCNPLLCLLHATQSETRSYNPFTVFPVIFSMCLIYILRFLRSSSSIFSMIWGLKC